MSSSKVSYHHGNLAAALEQAAIELLAEQGTPGVSLRAVARRAGVSHNAPYHHFGDRQGLLKAVAARGLQDLLAAMVTASTDTAPQERLLDVGVAYVHFAITHPALFEIIFDPEVCDPRAPNPVTAPFVTANDEFLNTTVREALPPDTSNETVAVTAAALWGAVHGLATLVSAGHLDAAVTRPGLAALLGLHL